MSLHVLLHEQNDGYDYERVLLDLDETVENKVLLCSLIFALFSKLF